MQDEPNNDYQQPNPTIPADNTPPPSQNLDRQPTAPGAVNQMAPTPNMRMITPLNPDVVAEPISPVGFSPNPVVSTPTVVENTVSNTPQPAYPQENNNTYPPLDLLGPATPPKKSHKVTIIVSILVFFLLLGGSTAGAWFWYQNPQKVITDSIINAVVAKSSIYNGTLNYNGGDVEVSMDAVAMRSDAAAGSTNLSIKIKYSGKEYKVKTDAVFNTKGDLFVKIEDIKALVTELEAAIGIKSTDKAILAAVDKMVEKVDGTWIKITSDDLKKYGENYAIGKTCLNNTIDKFKNDKKAVAEITDLYNKNQFITIDKNLGQQDGSFGYSLKGDDATLKSFAKGLQNTTIYKSLHACDDSFAINSDDIDISNGSDGKITSELWVGVWSHQITKFKLDGKKDNSSLATTIKPIFDQTVDIKTPASSITLTELESYISDVFESITARSSQTNLLQPNYVTSDSSKK